MNILIPDSWLRDYIKTNATPQDVSKALSLHAFSVEKLIEWEDKDTIYEVEVTPNRGDALSVLGIARELIAILPGKGFAAEWIKPDVEMFEESSEDNLVVDIKEKDLVPRFSAVVLSDIQSKPSSDLVRTRLEKVGIRSLNAVVDMTNYLMIETGQPMHVFDYDKIKEHKMVVRESAKGEKLVTLDGVERILPSGVIVIEDGEGRLIDLCGIMGCLNSEVDEKTTKVLFFVQIYDPVRIRRASMNLGHRTDAALRFEKGVDYEGVIPGLCAGVGMLEKEFGARVSSQLYDIKNSLPEKLDVPLDYERIQKIAGVEISKETIDKTLTLLGFEILNNCKVKVPSWRLRDIAISEDLAEEVIRLYGYYNLPDRLLTGEIPKRKEDKNFYWEDRAKDFLKFNGFYECYTNSATTKDLAGEGALEVANPLSQDLTHLRTSLIPQLLEVIGRNREASNTDFLGFYELSAVYLPKQAELPDQPAHLAVVAKGLSYSRFKGVIDALLKELGIKVLSKFDIGVAMGDVLFVEVNFDDLSEKASSAKTYLPISKYNSIKEDITLNVPSDVSYEQVVSTISSCDPRISKLVYKDLYENFLTISIWYLDRDNQITSADTKEIREKIFKDLRENLGVNLKS